MEMSLDTTCDSITGEAKMNDSGGVFALQNISE
jgi:hypothetical protein